VGHAQALRRLREALSPETLAQPADAELLQRTQWALERGRAQAEEDITDLEAAYRLASELESGETNALFEFLITHFAEDKKAIAFLRAQLKDHVSRLMMEFPEKFGEAHIRQSIKAA